MTIDELYDAYINQEDESFAEYIFGEFDLEDRSWEKEAWVRDYGYLLPEYDPSGVEIAGRERDVSYDAAYDRLDITKKATDRVYKTELDTLSTELGREMDKGRSVAGSLGLRTGSLATAVADTTKLAIDKTKNLGDRFTISEEQTQDEYNLRMVDAALDFEKAERQEKEDFFDSTMGQIERIGKDGALGDYCKDSARPVRCPGSDECVAHLEWCPGEVDVCGDVDGKVLDETKCAGYTSPERMDYYCTQTCSNKPSGVGANGSTCYDACMQGGAWTDATDGYVTLDFDSSEWFDENRDWLEWQSDCTDDEGNWICMSDDPTTEEVEGRAECEFCSMIWGKVDDGWGQSHQENMCGTRAADGEGVDQCDPSCCI
tara:strand:- start:14389 stop:15507 length:1119 start_codon:yes stop_codon:yes gene_type:complete